MERESHRKEKGRTREKISDLRDRKRSGEVGNARWFRSTHQGYVSLPSVFLRTHHLLTRFPGETYYSEEQLRWPWYVPVRNHSLHFQELPPNEGQGEITWNRFLCLTHVKKEHDYRKVDFQDVANLTVSSLQSRFSRRWKKQTFIQDIAEWIFKALQSISDRVESIF